MILVLPLIFVFIMVIVDFGIAIDRRQVIQHSVREGARRGAVGANVAEIQDVAVSQSQDVLVQADVSVCYVDGDDANGTPGNAGDSVRVTATFVHQMNMGSGETLGVFGVDANLFEIAMTPSAEARLETSVPGAMACP